MDIFQFFSRNKLKVTKKEHAVIVYFSYGLSDLQPLFEFEDEIIKVVTRTKTGEFDGNEVAANLHDGRLYLYGPDGDKLFNAIKPLLESNDFTKTAEVTIRYGDPKTTKRKTIKLVT